MKKSYCYNPKVDYFPKTPHPTVLYSSHTTSIRHELQFFIY